MGLSSVILSIIYRTNGERTIYSSYHLLRGKRSGQTLQDVKYYQLKPFFSLLPKLSIQEFDRVVEILQKEKFILQDDQGFIFLTKKGEKKVLHLRKYQFNGWEYRGRELVFFARLALTIQTLSFFRKDQKSFLPTQRNREVQNFVRGFLKGQPISDANFIHSFKNEIVKLLERSTLSHKQKIILTHRLDGFHCTGWTWNQLAEKLEDEVTSTYLLFIESLHILLNEIEQDPELHFLHKMTKDIKEVSYLTNSAKVTRNLFREGLSIEEIAAVRNLKISTIEDHFIEMSLNESTFPIEQFVSAEEVEQVRKSMHKLQTKRLRRIKEDLEHLSYFQLRMTVGVVAKEEKV